ncbi:Dynamin family protein [Actinacidiphila yanglinensis]|uniref:Dynamin family protein n=1 Tax=Actinacidiphila yanglinensis TaxID=310779 RepID=A0A1H6D3P0_9ACTN|nr:dynamin family protein [Actinacidiphila yanglinensis]SEG79937.1 Dynamin family protein [Actinacidiphila yanglinensis]
MATSPSALDLPNASAEPAPADPLTARVDALGELLGLSRTRISPDDLAESSELLARVGERRRLSLDHTVVALAGATGSGKSTLFNALTGLELSATGVRRPTTARPVSCAWQPERAAGLLDRLGVAPQDRYARYGLRDVPAPSSGQAQAQAVHGHVPEIGHGQEQARLPEQAECPPDRSDVPAGASHCSVGDVDEAGADLVEIKERSLDGLVLIDLPDHDSAAPGHREQVDRLLRLVDVVVWVLDPEKYADATLHERYLRPLAGHADVTVLVLNQVDRLPGDTADLVLDDLRGLLDEDGLAVGEHGEAGAVVLAASALTGQGVPDLRAVLAQIVAERAAAVRRLAADMDRTASGLQPLYVGEGGAGLTDPAREEFVDRLADAVGAAGAGQSAEKEWSSAAWDACGTPWSRLLGERTGSAGCSRFVRTMIGSPGWRTKGPRRAEVRPTAPSRTERSVLPATRPTASRPVIDEAVRGLSADAARGLPVHWARAVRDAARRGGEGLPAALDAAAVRARPGTPERPGWWSVAAAVQWLLMALALAGVVCLSAIASGSLDMSWWPPLVTVGLGGLGGPLVSGTCRLAARGPARRYGQAAERRLRDAAADCGRARVLEPVAAELMRYREVREQFAVVAGSAPALARLRSSASASSRRGEVPAGVGSGSDRSPE